jgi:hypothetical protein
MSKKVIIPLIAFYLIIFLYPIIFLDIIMRDSKYSCYDILNIYHSGVSARVYAFLNPVAVLGIISSLIMFLFKNNEKIKKLRGIILLNSVILLLASVMYFSVMIDCL